MDTTTEAVSAAYSALGNKLLRDIQVFATLAHDSLQQLATGRNVVDQPGRHAGPYEPGVHVARLQRDAAAGAGHELANLLELRTARTTLHPHYLFGDDVLEHARGVAQRAKDEERVALRAQSDGAFDVLVDGGLAGADEACAHVDALRAQR